MVGTHSHSHTGALSWDALNPALFKMTCMGDRVFAGWETQDCDTWTRLPKQDRVLGSPGSGGYGSRPQGQSLGCLTISL